MNKTLVLIFLLMIGCSNHDTNNAHNEIESIEDSIESAHHMNDSYITINEREPDNIDIGVIIPKIIDSIPYEYFIDINDDYMQFIEDNMFNNFEYKNGTIYFPSIGFSNQIYSYDMKSRSIKIINLKNNGLKVRGVAFMDNGHGIVSFDDHSCIYDSNFSNFKSIKAYYNTILFSNLNSYAYVAGNKLYWSDYKDGDIPVDGIRIHGNCQSIAINLNELLLGELFYGADSHAWFRSISMSGDVVSLFYRDTINNESVEDFSGITVLSGDEEKIKTIFQRHLGDSRKDIMITFNPKGSILSILELNNSFENKRIIGRSIAFWSSGVMYRYDPNTEDLYGIVFNNWGMYILKW